MSEERKFCCGAEHEEHPDPRNYNWGKIGLGSTLKPYGKSEIIPFKIKSGPELCMHTHSARRFFHNCYVNLCPYSI